MKVSELGEFGLIELLARIVGRAGGDVLVGIGDDAACWRTDAAIQLATSDALIQDVHFTLSTTTWRELGWKALAVNISDIAAMGGLPQYALVSLGLPGDTEVESVTELYEGMAELTHLFNVAIVGGDVVAAPIVVLSLAVVGAAQTGHILTRSAAAPGEQIAVTGYLGASGAGLAMLKSGLEFDKEIATSLREAHLKPNPRVVEGQTLARYRVKAAIDLSDGLVSDLAKLCKASGVGARLFVDQIPVHPLVRHSFADDSINLALSGGEDYELLFTAPTEVISQVREAMPCPITVIGEIVEEEPGRVRLFDEHGNEVQLEKEGWEHFAPGERG
jgi:thiamine-monophosphate kinase